MAHFRGTIQGGRGKASRLGHKTSGLRVTARSWTDGVNVELSWNDELGTDWLSIYMESGPTLYRGRLDGVAAHVAAQDPKTLRDRADQEALNEAMTAAARKIATE